MTLVVDFLVSSLLTTYSVTSAYTQHLLPKTSIKALEKIGYFMSLISVQIFYTQNLEVS